MPRRNAEDEWPVADSLLWRLTHHGPQTRHDLMQGKLDAPGPFRRGARARAIKFLLDHGLAVRITKTIGAKKVEAYVSTPDARELYGPGDSGT